MTDNEFKEVLTKFIVLRSKGEPKECIPKEEMLKMNITQFETLMFYDFVATELNDLFINGLPETKMPIKFWIACVLRGVRER